MRNLNFTILLGLARTICIRCIYGIFGREITKYTAIYGAHIRFSPTVIIMQKQSRHNESVSDRMRF
jgi:hypothetical protein